MLPLGETEWRTRQTVLFLELHKKLQDEKFHLKKKNLPTNEELDELKFLVSLGSVIQPDSAILTVY